MGPLNQRPLTKEGKEEEKKKSSVKILWIIFGKRKRDVTSSGIGRLVVPLCISDLSLDDHPLRRPLPLVSLVRYF